MRAGNPVVVAVVGGLVLAILSVCAPMASAQPGTEPGALEIFDVIPAETTLRIRVGERRQFSIWVRGERLLYQWMVDGGPVGDRHAWTFVPRATDVGFHLVTVAVEGAEGRVTHTWRVQVDVASAAPSPPATAPPGPTPPASLEPTPTTERAPSTSTSSSTTTTPRPSTSSTREPTTTSTREPTTTSTRLPTTTSTRQPTTTSTRESTTSTRAPTTTTTVRSTTSTSTSPPTTLVRTTTTLARTGTITDSEVRALFERYKAAWRNHDIQGLESVGQIATQGQADALKEYFESVRDLEVDVTILGIVIAGDEARVRFIRRDRFRDPGGSLVTKESPVIEKRVVRTPGGLRLAPVR